jgi:hypothetical protein
MLPRRTAVSSLSRRLAVACAALAVLLAGGTLEAETLTLEEVVRLHVSGVGDSALIARIRTADVDFDLSDAMLGELRAAGLSEAVIAAMLERQNALHPPPPPDPAAPEEEVAADRATLTLHVSSAAGKGVPFELRVPSAAPPGVAGKEAAAIDDAALWVACVDPTHVPDHWRMESPLGRDFEVVPRHRMLHFLSGAKSEGGAGSGPLRLAIPGTIEVALDPGDVHRIVIGVAVHVGGRWLAASLSSPHALEVAGAPALDVTMAQRGTDPRVRIDVAPAVSDRAPAK